MTESIKVYLTAAQKNKLNGGKTFQLSAHQLSAGHGKHAVEIQMTSRNHKQLLKNVSHNKGYRFTKDKIEGAGIFSNIAKGMTISIFFLISVHILTINLCFSSSEKNHLKKYL